MTNVNIMEPCPCGTGVNFANCCQPHLLGLEKPDTAEKLLRSRYTAFVAKQVDYILQTHHPETVKDIDKNSIKEWSENSTWQGLEIVDVDNNLTAQGETTIEFIARYAQSGVTQVHRETSLFKKSDDAWYFYDVKKNAPIKNENKIGRNDPCKCGSGKKYKKCCGQ